MTPADLLLEHPMASEEVKGALRRPVPARSHQAAISDSQEQAALGAYPRPETTIHATVFVRFYSVTNISGLGNP